MPFQVIATDFVGPIYYRTKTKKESEACILLFTCCVSRANILELISNATTQEFIKCLKRLIARRGKRSIIYLDNAKSFRAAAKWLKQIIVNCMTIYQRKTTGKLTSQKHLVGVIALFRKINWGDQKCTLQVIRKNTFTLEQLRRSSARR